MSLSFDNTATAFAYKSDKDLKSAKTLFSTMCYHPLVEIGTKFTPFLMKTGLPIDGIIRKTIFKQFIGGETMEDTRPVCEMLDKYGVDVVLDYGVEKKETEENFERTADEYINIIRYAASQKNIPAVTVKVTKIARFGLLQKLNVAPRLRSGSLDNEEEAMEWQKVRKRMIRICDTADEMNIGILVDAEKSWVQDPIDRLAIDMMNIYNKDRAMVFNTLQMYRTDRLSFLNLSHRIAKIHNFILGVKLVRGAYAGKERERALQMGYPSPVYQNQSDTDNAFDAAAAYCIENSSNIDCVICTHNEESIRKALSLADSNDLPRFNQQIHFSQLYGMGDNITFNLAEKGYPVTKSLPFGAVRDVIPYLMQLARENGSVKKETNRDLALIKKELARRKNGIK